MKKFIAVSLIGIMAASTGVATSPVIATGLTELIAEELIVDETRSAQINVAGLPGCRDSLGDIATYMMKR